MLYVLPEELLKFTSSIQLNRPVFYYTVSKYKINHAIEKQTKIDIYDRYMSSKKLRGNWVFAKDIHHVSVLGNTDLVTFKEFVLTFLHELAHCYQYESGEVYEDGNLPWRERPSEIVADRRAEFWYNRIMILNSNTIKERRVNISDIEECMCISININWKGISCQKRKIFTQ